VNFYQKLTRFRAGLYKFPPPPISHAYWGEDRWVDYIDAYGEWL